MARPLIMVAPNGARRSKRDHPRLPVTIAETVDTAIACQRAGAHALHLHVRDDTGRHSLDPGRYREALAELSRVAPALRVQITTEAAGCYAVADQLDCLRQVRPGWASLSVREIARDPGLADTVYGTCAGIGTEVQHILYDTEDARLLCSWQARGIVREAQPSVLLVLGRYGDPSASKSNPAPFVDAVPPGSPWMLCAFGPNEHASLRAAARCGGDLRVGFENSLCGPGGENWPDNAASVAALVQSIRAEAA